MSVLETAAAVAKLAKDLGGMELRQQALELQVMCSGLVMENRELRERVRDLEGLLKLKERLVYRNNAYWLADTNGDAAGPFCATCWDKDHRAIRMEQTSPGYAACNVCKAMPRIDGEPTSHSVRLTR